MMKKLLLIVLIVFSSTFIFGQQITLSTTSTSSTWSPRSIANTGSDLVWEASNAIIGTVTQTSNVPTFDFSANDGSPIAITISSADNLAGLTRFQVYTLEVTEIDLTGATQLENIHIGNNQISSLDISTLPNLTLLRAATNNLSSIDISNNSILTRLELASNLLTSPVLDGLITQVDAFGETDGILTLSGNQGLTQAVESNYNSLVAKGWTIDVPVPGPPVTATITLTTTSTVSDWAPRSITNTGNAFTWEASNALIGTQTQIANIPTFDFSANDGSPINITITSNDGFTGLSRFQAYTLNITDIDLTQATQLENIHIGNNQISSIDISTLPNLNLFRAGTNGITDLDISNNPLLTRLEMAANLLPSAVLDGLVNQLDAFGLTDGILTVSGNQGITVASQPGYDNLVNKSWSIDVPAPGPPVIATMTITTTSTSSAWFPRSITNTGNAFTWEATNALIGTQTQVANSPTFDFSANDGSPINITITSNDGFSGLTRFQVYTLDITAIDATAATQLDNFHVQANDISSIDISTLTNLTFFRASGNNISSLDISNNSILNRLEIDNNVVTSSELDAIVNQLDAFGQTDGILNLSGNQGITESAQPGYDNLIAKGWTIDVSAPGPPVIATMSITTTSTSNAWSPRSVTNTGNAFVWEASNAAIGTLTQTANVPTFDFSANDGSPINITVTSNDGFSGLTRFQVYTLDITAIDATAATQLGNYHIQNNNISDVDISTLANVTFFRANDNAISSIDISNNSLLNRLEITNNNLTSNELDAIVNQLDAFGLSDGILNISGNQGITESAQPGYDNLIAKGWTIDVDAPAPPVIATMTITTTSTSNAWFPRSVTNTGNAFVWEASNALIGTLTQTANVPTFDFSANDGSPITITVTSNDGFSGLTRFQVYTLDITAIDATAATELDNFHVQNNAISSIDISTMSNLTFFRGLDNNITALDVSGNPLLTRLEVENNSLSSSELDAIVNQLDAFGLLDGILNISGNEGLTESAQPAYDNLIAKGWSIDVDAPGPPVIATMSITTTSTSNAWSPRSVTNTGNALVWEASNALIGTLTQTANVPIFDFSANDGSPINITVTSNDGLSGLTRFQIYTLDITDLDLTQATNLENLHIGNNQIGSIDLSTLTNLNFFRAGTNNLSVLDISANSLLIRLELLDNNMTTAELDAIVNQLDAFGQLDGILDIGGNEDLSIAAQPAFDNLVSKGWTIDVAAPTPPVLTTLSITTTSTSDAWSPRSVANTGNVLVWEATNGLIGTLTQTANVPTFDFSANDGSPISITVTSDDGFTGLTRFQIYTLDITDVDVNEAVELTNFHIQNNNISNVDISTLTNLTFFRANQNNLTSLDISNNDLLTRLELTDNGLTTAVLDGIVNQLDVFGLLDGILTIANNEPLSMAAQPSYDNLITKGWTIDVDAPTPPVFSTITMTTTSNISAWSPRSVLNTGNVLVWEATNALIGTLTQTANVPVFDFSANDGSPISITVTSDDGFGGLTRLQVYTLEITDIDATEAVELTNFHIQNNNISDVDISTLTNLTFFRANENNLSVLDISNNNVLTRLELTDNILTSATLDGIVNQLDVFGQFDGILTIANNLGLTLAAQPSYDNLIAKGWTIDVGPPTDSDIMITQYYHGFGGNDKWVEISNISNEIIPAGKYYLVLFDDDVARTGVIESATPSENTPIPAMDPGETLLFWNGAAVSPSAGNIGDATRIVSPVCSFTGDDVILISTSNTTNSYLNRVDIIGSVSPNPGSAPDGWGVNVSYIKGGCSTEVPHMDYEETDWTFILLSDVDDAIANTNLALGTQVVGPTEFNGSTWSNLQPDQSRTATIASSFTGAPANFISCNLTIANGVDVVFDSGGASSFSIVIYGDFVNNGSLTIGDKESLVVYNADATIGEITKIEKSTPLDDINDVTYWSSPVAGSQIDEIFTGVQQDRIFEFRAGDDNPFYAGTNYKYWWVATGTMTRAKGYAAPGASTGEQTLTFSGVPFNGPFEINTFFSGTIDTGTANENFNLIGNPYPAAIDMQRILIDNPTVNEIALWTHGTTVDPDTGEYDDGDYIFYNSSGSTDGVTNNIASSQAFMIRTVAFGGVSFEDSYKLIGQNDQFYKSSSLKKAAEDTSEENDKIWLRLRSGTEKNDILLSFMEDATDGYDMYYDATGNLYNDNISLIEKNSKFYSKIGNDKFVIQGLSPFGARKNIELGFDTKKTGWFKMSINRKDGALKDSEIYLVDTYMNVKHDLNKSDYEFKADQVGAFPDRFQLEFVNPNIDFDPEDLIDTDAFIVTNDFDLMKVKSGKTVNEIKVFDLLGRVIIHNQPKQKSFELNTGSVKLGTVMIIEARLEDGSFINTKSIKY